MYSCVPFVVSQVQKELDKSHANIRFTPLPSLPPSVSTDSAGFSVELCQIPVAAVSSP